MLGGKCSCGVVRYRVPDEFLYAANCPCSRCRAATGSAFKPFAGDREKLQLTHGADRLLVVGDEDLNDNFDQVQVMTQLGLMPAPVTT